MSLGHTFLGAAAEYAARTFYGYMEEREESFDVTTNVQQIFAPDAERVFMHFVNLGANNVFLAFDNKPSATRGILLAPQGGYLTVNAFEDFMISTRGVWCVGAGASELYFFTMRRFSKIHPEEINYVLGK